MTTISVRLGQSNDQAYYCTLSTATTLPLVLSREIAARLELKETEEVTVQGYVTGYEEPSSFFKLSPDITVQVRVENVGWKAFYVTAYTSKGRTKRPVLMGLACDWELTQACAVQVNRGVVTITQNESVPPTETSLCRRQPTTTPME